jgi:putative DNA primase/helicase
MLGALRPLGVRSAVANKKPPVGERGRADSGYGGTKSFDLAAFVCDHGGDLSRDGRSAYIPGPGHSRRDRGVKVVLADDGRPIVHSFHGDDWRQLRHELGLEQIQGESLSPSERQRRQQVRRAAELERRRQTQAFCARVWGETVEATGSPVETYLRSRGLAGEIPLVLRFHRACPRSYPDQAKPIRVAPSMVAIVQGPDGRPSGLHCTALLIDGSAKAFGDRSRVMFGEIVGGSVRLSQVPERGDLAVCEGIETAWSFGQMNDLSCWAALSTSMLKAFKPPAGLRRLVIGADGDQPGLVTARALAERASTQCEALVVAAPEGRDWNDELRDST